MNKNTKVILGFILSIVIYIACIYLLTASKVGLVLLLLTFGVFCSYYLFKENINNGYKEITKYRVQQNELNALNTIKGVTANISSKEYHKFLLKTFLEIYYFFGIITVFNVLVDKHDAPYITLTSMIVYLVLVISYQTFCITKTLVRKKIHSGYDGMNEEEMYNAMHPKELRIYITIFNKLLHCIELAFLLIALFYTLNIYTF